ncbi:MAG: hypothetical protein HOC71_09805 [Candidatus Latescibacteria bacterium]|jgi:hypothetical protein|nr:hypothetical protein [Candidatus Latescibacterota bacterium]
MGDENRQVIFCQGDKKELEEITGEEYVFIGPCKNQTIDTSYRKSKDFISTFGGIWCYVPPEERMKTNITRKLKRELFNRAVSLDADAVIHYTTKIFQNNEGVYEGFVRGTFLKQKK